KESAALVKDQESKKKENDKDKEQGPDKGNDPEKERRKELAAKINSLEMRIGLLEFNKPLAPFAHAVQDEEKPEDCHIAIRGNAHQLGTEVPRGFVRLASFEEHRTAWKGSGRLELAKWLTDERQPLTPRVYVNRVWQQLFGSGIVRSSDNFGIRGDLPSHP